MPYLGNEPATAYTSTTKDSFSGDGSTTNFTMSKPATTTAVRVVVENVVQNPTVAYSCGGTSLTFTSAPPAGTNNIYVVHLGPPAATIAPPSTITNTTTFTGGIAGDLAVDTNTLFVDSTNNHVGFGTTTPAKPLSVNLAGGGDFIAEFQNTTDATPYGIHVKDASSGANGYPLFQVTSGDGSDTYFRVDSGTGITTKPAQPAFQVNKGGTSQSNISVGSDVLVTFGTERFDVGSNFASNTFTAPVTGKYVFSMLLRVDSVDIDSNYYIPFIETSNHRYRFITEPEFTGDASYWSFTLTVLADMDANDTCTIKINQGTGAAQSDISGDPDYTWWTGYLAC